ncbi:MAG: hypothetical protein JWR04_333, partial [Rhodoglobus sp.]|nr:hypothetical protein [Rhodoglobus sp.]
MGLVTIPLVLLPAAAATASHNRASTGDFSITGGYATWTVDTVWRSFDSGSLVGETVGDTIGVYELSSASDAPDSGVYTGVDLELSSYVDDFSNPLFGVATETIEGDVSSLEDGIYEVYAETCCRVGPENGDGNFSQWVRFTKTAGVYNVAPVFNNAPLFDWLPEAGNLVLDYTATDP